MGVNMEIFLKDSVLVSLAVKLYYAEFTGNGIVFLEIDGSIVEYNLALAKQ